MAARWVHCALGWLLLLLLAGCITRPLAPPATEPGDVARPAWLHAHQDWSFTGRVALKQPGKGGGSGRIEWQQQGAQYRIRLSAPVTRQSWQLTGDLVSGHGWIEGIEGSPLSADAEALLWETTGWEIPLRLLPDWVRGIGSREVQSHGWEVVWQQWHPPTDTLPALPKRIEAVRGDGADAPRIRLIIDHWEFP